MRNRNHARTQTDEVSLIGIPTEKEMHIILNILKNKRGPMAVIECFQQIPCNVCETSCQFGAIRIGRPMTNLPDFDQAKCRGCGVCVSKCPGLAIFVIDMNYSPGEAAVSLPYEFLPLPRIGEKVQALNRYGKPICFGKILKVASSENFDKTHVITISVPKKHAMNARSIRIPKNMRKEIGS